LTATKKTSLIVPAIDGSAGPEEFMEAMAGHEDYPLALWYGVVLHHGNNYHATASPIRVVTFVPWFPVLGAFPEEAEFRSRRVIKMAALEAE